MMESFAADSGGRNNVSSARNDTPEKKTGWWSSALFTSFVGILLSLVIILLGWYVYQSKSTGGQYSTDDGAEPPAENAADPFIPTLIISAGKIITAMGRSLKTRSGLEQIFSDVLGPQSTV